MQPTPLYDALAAALSPISKTGRVPLNRAVKVATEVAEAFHADLPARIVSLEAQLAIVTAQVASTTAAAAAAAAAAESEILHTQAAQASVIGDLLTRIASFEHLFAVAATRWDHEGGPPAVKEALEACRVRP